MAETNGNGRIRIEFNFDDASLGELEFVEEYTGKSISQILVDLTSQNLSARVIRALAFTAKRREDPEFKMSSLEDFKFGNLDIVRGETDPTGTAPETEEATATTGS